MHEWDEAEAWFIFRGNGICEIQICEAGDVHQLHNDTDQMWVVIGVKTNAQIKLPNTEVDWAELQ